MAVVEPTMDEETTAAVSTFSEEEDVAMRGAVAEIAAACACEGLASICANGFQVSELLLQGFDLDGATALRR